ncbi:MAG: SEC-C domain-containing protein [Gammaproteobacteria bacterium]|nr:SEC-C domain-containing protein [Gammaproteobacteria bacterium]
MKPGRNDPCPCGSGKKYKRCCMNSGPKLHTEVFDDVEQVVAMNPNLTLDELNVVMQHRMHKQNNRPNPDFCGLSPTQMANWLYAPFDELDWVTIRTPDPLSFSPVMRYLTLIIDEGMQNNGSFKATSKGNLPVKLVKQASDLLPKFAVSQFKRHLSISEFSGSHEGNFNALHYTRILAEIAGIIYRRSGRYHIEKAAQKKYLNQGIQDFFKPMLKAAITKYNWGYLDSWEYEVDLRTFWLFMLWRMQAHASVDQLIDEVATAFPDLLHHSAPDDYYTPIKFLGIMIESRFIERFLQFWGFITFDSKRFFAKEQKPQKVQIQPLLIQTFQFNVKH